MGIRVKFFASLADRVGMRDTVIDSRGVATVEDAWRSAVSEQRPPGNIQVAINHEYANLGSTVKEGDELAFFPPVTGG